MFKRSLCFVFLLILASVNCEVTIAGTDNPNVTVTEPPAYKNETNATTIITTVTAPTTHMPPTPAPSVPPKDQHFNLTIGKNVCILACFAAQISLKYNNSEHLIETTYLNIDDNTTVDVDKSSCGKDKANLALFVNGDGENLLIFQFVKNTTYYVDKIIVQLNASTIDMPLYPGSELIQTSAEKKLFDVDTAKSYSCKKPETITMDPFHDVEVTLVMSDVKLDAFRESEDTQYRSAQECEADNEVNDIVPIAVGCALAALVVIVLIAYFIGRRRSRRLAYQSV